MPLFPRSSSQPIQSSRGSTGCQVLRRRYGKEADLWSCGVMLYILLSGVPPFWGETEQQIFDSILKGKLDFESEPWPSISSAARDAVQVLLVQVPPLPPPRGCADAAVGFRMQAQ